MYNKYFKFALFKESCIFRYKEHLKRKVFSEMLSICLNVTGKIAPNDFVVDLKFNFEPL